MPFEDFKHILPDDDDDSDYSSLVDEAISTTYAAQPELNTRERIEGPPPPPHPIIRIKEGEEKRYQKEFCEKEHHLWNKIDQSNNLSEREKEYVKELQTAFLKSNVSGIQRLLRSAFDESYASVVNVIEALGKSLEEYGIKVTNSDSPGIYNVTFMAKDNNTGDSVWSVVPYMIDNVEKIPTGFESFRVNEKTGKYTHVGHLNEPYNIMAARIVKPMEWEVIDPFTGKKVSK
jgi:hypothetical protein